MPGQAAYHRTRVLGLMATALELAKIAEGAVRHQGGRADTPLAPGAVQA